MIEFIYALSNPAMPGLLKLGRTTVAVAKRASELSGASGVPLPFVVEHVERVSDSEYAERDVHDILIRCRVSLEREFFRCSLADAVTAMALAKKVDDGRLREAGRFAEWLRANSHRSELPAVMSWLEAAKPRDVIAALRREAA